MDDSIIIDLYWQRDEEAITQTAQKYGSYCHGISFNMLHCYRNTESGETGCVEGHWQLPVVLSASDVLAPVELGILSVRAYAYYYWPVSFQLPCRMKLQDVSITSADITYRCDQKYMQMLAIGGKPVWMRMFSISAVLKNGNSISTVSGSDYMDIDGLMVANYRWEVPFSLDDLDYIRFGNSKVLINR